jgi:hypothetical protein
MEQTTNNTVRIVRLQSGEDIIAGMTEDNEGDVVLLDNPMHLIFKRTTQGTVMMMMPWLPIELIKSNIATIYTSDILTVIEPKDDLVEYYGNVTHKTNLHAMEEHEHLGQRFKEMMDAEDEDDDEFFDIGEEDNITDEEIEIILEQKKKSRLH